LGIKLAYKRSIYIVKMDIIKKTYIVGMMIEGKELEKPYMDEHYLN